MPITQPYDLDKLVEEFSRFEVDEQFGALDSQPFSQAMAEPEPDFVIPFLQARTLGKADKGLAIRDLYAFFLEKRYYNRINLLYFAFDVFCSRIALPDEILEITPLPHEEGRPLFKNKLKPGFKV